MRLTRRGRNTLRITAALLYTALLFAAWNATRGVDDNTGYPIRTHATVSPTLIGERVTQELADALAEGDAPDATTRDWELCTVFHDWDADYHLVTCPDGYTESY